MADYQPIDYAKLNDALLQRVESLLAAWLPEGFERNGLWYVGDFDGSPGESANVNMDTGKWCDNGRPGDAGGDLISLHARIFNKRNSESAVELMGELGWERPSYAQHTSRPAPSQTSARAASSAPSDAPADDGQATPVAAEPVRRKREKKWQAVVPVPPHAPKAGFLWKYEDKKRNVWVELDAVRTWEYSFEGKLYGYVARFERVSSDGEIVKDTIARTWCQNLTDDRGLQAWHWKQWEDPRPLYVPATLLSHDGKLPVVIVEGEKCAEAGHQLLGHEFDFVSWPGGAQAWAKAAWGWLMGRTIFLWPDCDAQRERLSKAEREADVSPATKPYLPERKQPGMAAMVNIGTELVARQRCTAVHMVKIPQPGAVSEGWDIADAIAEGWTADQVRAFIRSAVPFVPPNDEARAQGKSTLPLAGADQEEEAISWRRMLLTTDKMAIKAVRENIVLALDGTRMQNGTWLPGIPEAEGVIGFNDFTNDVLKLKDTPWGTKAGVWAEEDELELGNWLTRAHYLPPMSRQTLEEAVIMVARRHRFHPARERFQALQGTWDGTKRLGTWLARCCRKEGVLPDDDPLQQYLARVGTWMVMATCARVLPELKRGAEVVQGPGCKFDYMLILEGGQGLGKSTLARLLGGDWFADTGLVLGDKDSYQNLQGVLVYEWGELDSLTRSEVTKVKQFISSQKDRFRASFDRRPKDYPRQVVFIGTTNESHYLSDPTGNRRFWPVRVTRFIDLVWVRENMPQLFAEALHYLAEAERFHPTQKEQRELFDPQQLERTVENSLESAIRRYLYDENQKVGMNGLNGTLVNEITLNDLLTVLGISIDKQTQVLTKQASAALGRMGWERGRASGKGGKARPWVYRRPASGSDTAGVEPEGAASSSFNRPTQGDNTAGADDDCPL